MFSDGCSYQEVLVKGLSGRLKTGSKTKSKVKQEKQQ